MVIRLDRFRIVFSGCVLPYNTFLIMSIKTFHPSFFLYSLMQISSWLFPCTSCLVSSCLSFYGKFTCTGSVAKGVPCLTFLSFYFSFPSSVLLFFSSSFLLFLKTPTITLPVLLL
ncbi:hypothetical protein BDV29DRAFT_174410 [Aspergillus leporis]|uniref:Uncharacterized protein n=1 Tax=Aspergillus leporis TaxID=41062 RepID=A0A5N5X042_9EURO|nr:hypothetical protein BDV29DRAFT_174410 [Aspergillus leporis]